MVDNGDNNRNTGNDETNKDFEIQIESLNKKLNDLTETIKKRDEKIQELNEYIVKNITSKEKPKELKQIDATFDRISDLKNELKEIYKK